jgi:hypothetical protein
MFLDYQLELSSNQAANGANGTAIVSNNTIDTGAPGTYFNGLSNGVTDIGSGEPVKLYAIVSSNFTGGSGGVKLDYINSANANLAGAVILQSVTLAANAPAAGAVIANFTIPQNTLRYVGAQYTPLTSNTTAGGISCWLCKDTPVALT